MNARHTLNPFLAVMDADDIVQSYVAVLGAELTRRVPAYVPQEAERIDHFQYFV